MSPTSTPQTVYIVTDRDYEDLPGEYSDYHVVAVFADKATAEAFVESGGGREILEAEVRVRA